MDRKFIKYVGLELDPNKAIQARNKGLPVFYGDIGRQEVAHAFNVGKAKAVIVCIADKAMANRAVIALRRWYPDLKIFARAADADHASRLQKTLDIAAMVPILPEDNLLLTLPFGGAVLKALGASPEEVNAILEVKRKEVLSGKGLEQDEQQVALLQLGIDPDKRKRLEQEKEEAKKQEHEIKEHFSESGEDEEDNFKSTVEAAAERFGQTKETSPFVAQVIGEVCPDGAKPKQEECDPNDEECEAPGDLSSRDNPPALEIINVQSETESQKNATDVKL